VIARHRGDLRAHSRWRPPVPTASSASPAADEDGLLVMQQPDELLSEPSELEPSPVRKRRSRALIALVTIVVIAVIAGHEHTAAVPAAPNLPSTPHQWVDQWTAAALQSPSEVCDRLYAPALARAFKGDTSHGCTWYYTSVKSTSFRIRHVLQDGPTVAVEAQEVGAGRKWGYFTMLLSHVHGGWQAVDLVPGGSVRAR
jgi:hypothetical protein